MIIIMKIFFNKKCTNIDLKIAVSSATKHRTGWLRKDEYRMLNKCWQRLLLNGMAEKMVASCLHIYSFIFQCHPPKYEIPSIQSTIVLRTNLSMHKNTRIGICFALENLRFTRAHYRLHGRKCIPEIGKKLFLNIFPETLHFYWFSHRFLPERISSSAWLWSVSACNSMWAVCRAVCMSISC
jgi:hypothetical protein